MAEKLLQIRLQAYDHRILDLQVKNIISSIKKSGAIVVGPVPLPTEKEIFTVLRSPHVNKTSREQFERRTHKRLILVKNATAQTKEALNLLKVPSGIDIFFKI